MESRIQESFSCGIRNPELWNREFSTRNPESPQRLESRIQVPLTRKLRTLESGIHSRGCMGRKTERAILLPRSIGSLLSNSQCQQSLHCEYLTTLQRILQNHTDKHIPEEKRNKTPLVNNFSFISSKAEFVCNDSNCKLITKFTIHA